MEECWAYLRRQVQGGEAAAAAHPPPPHPAASRRNAPSLLAGWRWCWCWCHDAALPPSLPAAAGARAKRCPPPVRPPAVDEAALSRQQRREWQAAQARWGWLDGLSPTDKSWVGFGLFHAHDQAGWVGWGDRGARPAGRQAVTLRLRAARQHAGWPAARPALAAASQPARAAGACRTLPARPPLPSTPLAVTPLAPPRHALPCRPPLSCSRYDQAWQALQWANEQQDREAPYDAAQDDANTAAILRMFQVRHPRLL